MAMTEYHHGSMDIEAHEKTFHGFIRAIMWIVGICFAVLIFLAVFNS